MSDIGVLEQWKVDNIRAWEYHARGRDVFDREKPMVATPPFEPFDIAITDEELAEIRQRADAYKYEELKNELAHIQGRWAICREKLADALLRERYLTDRVEELEDTNDTLQVAVKAFALMIDRDDQ